LIEDIYRRTNTNFIERTQNTPETDRSSKRAELTPVDFSQYLGILIMMGIDKKPELTMHWETHRIWKSNLISLQCPAIDFTY